MKKAELAMLDSAKRLLDVRRQGPDGPVEICCAMDNPGLLSSALMSATGANPHPSRVPAEKTMLLRCFPSMTKSGLVSLLRPQPNW